VLKRNSPLAAALNQGGRSGVAGQRRLRLGEERGWSLVQLSAFAAKTAELRRTVRHSLGADLPLHVGEAAVFGSRVLMKVGSEEFWVITRNDEDSAPALRAAVAPAVGGVIPLSHARTCIWIEGLCARAALATAIAVDLDPEAFRSGSFALTGLHHTPVLIYRSRETRYELYVMRTFALWTWEWLTDAALPFGYEVVAATDVSRLR
jgi:methylglutamate dehydrogenase subunit D